MAIFSRVKTFFKYKSRRIYLKLSVNTLDIDISKLSEEQRAGIQIVKVLARNAESEILVAPISDRYYIRNGEFFIIVSYQQISIINSVYHYDIFNTESINRHIMRYLRRVMENRRSKMEQEVMNKIQKSLTTILIDIHMKLNDNQENHSYNSQ